MRKVTMRPTIYAGVLVAAIVGVIAATGRRTVASAGPTGHSHGAGGRGDSAAKAVMFSAADARRIGVTFAAVTRGALIKEVRTVGQVTVDETRVQTISLKVDGWIERLVVNAVGQPVRAGQPLLTIYSPMLVTAQEELLLAMRLANDVVGAASDAQQRAASLVASARRRLEYWEVDERDIAEIERTGTVHKTLTLRSPTGGHVLEKTVLAGQKIMAGDGLYKIADLTTVWIEGDVFEQDLADVQVGQRVEADFEALPGEHRAGRIAYIHPTLNLETRTARIRVVLANDDLRLKPGMFATIRIAGTARHDVLMVPRAAVLSTGERNIVFVRGSSGALEPREVSIGAANDERIEVLRGVVAGETLVASATFLVDAESNLATALGGMGNMPGMDMIAPPKPLETKPPR